MAHGYQPKKTGSVSTQINKQVKEQVIKNRAILTSVFYIVHGKISDYENIENKEKKNSIVKIVMLVCVHVWKGVSRR
jgi:DNA repair exonuclease SbcCD ATPase subunit